MKDFFKFMFASCLGTLMVFVVMICLFFGIVFIGISGALIPKTPSKLSKQSVLVLELDRPIYERESSEFEIFINSSPETSLNKILQAIEHAKTDKNITGIYIKEGMGLQAGWATMEEIRNALLDFKKTNKFVYAYADGFSQQGYYIATTADKMYLHPAGFVELTGLSAQTLFLKDLLSKLEIDVDLIRPNSNAYKSAGEMFLLDKMSEANREQVRAYLNSMWAHISQNIAAKRNMSVLQVNEYADSLKGFIATEAFNAKLVDSLGFESDVLEAIRKHTLDEKISDIQLIPIKRYCKTITPKHAKLKVAVIYAEGDVVDGMGYDSRTIYAQNMVKAIRKAVENDEVKAIVLRINSHGGSAIASEIITNEIFQAQKKKPIVASFGDVAASAGYEIACLSTKIVAEPTTITGSIGVFGVVPNFEKFLKNKIGITFDTVKTNQNSAMFSFTRGLSAVERNALQRNVEDFYVTFCQKVALGRHTTPQYIDSIGRGRVWTGTEALKLGLVDEIGGIDRAIQLAAELANMNDYSIIELPGKQDPYQQFRHIMETEAMEKMYASQDLGKLQQIYKELNKLSNMKGTQARLPYLITIK